MESNNNTAPRPARFREGPPFCNLDMANIIGNKSKFYRSGENKDFLIRRSFVNIEDPEGDSDLSLSEKEAFLRNKIVQFKKIIANLPVNMVKCDYIIGKDPVKNIPVIYVTTENIDGENLNELSVLKKETAEKIDALYAQIIDELVKQYRENDYSWFDPNNGQFMYGKAPDDKKPDVYLVDLDPNVFKWDDPDLKRRIGISGQRLLQNRITWIISEIGNLEKKVEENGFAFNKTREAYRRAKELFASNNNKKI